MKGKYNQVEWIRKNGTMIIYYVFEVRK